jgi:hypothetical protein
LNEQLHYAFDPAGNLNYRTNNALIENFQVNTLNELTANTNGGSLTVMGTTTSQATNVTVNSTSAQHYGDATFAAPGLPLTTTYTATASDSLGRSATNTNSWQPIAWRVPPILMAPDELLGVHGLATRQVRHLLYSFRTPQHKGHPHPVLSRSTSKIRRCHQTIFDQPS